ncbi:MAG: hypothetical protein ACXVNM_15465 [Bacteroidia bacterium]
MENLKHTGKAVIILTLLSAFSCRNKDCEASFEFYPPDSDTVNLTDCSGLKQGKWVPSRNNKLTDTVFYRNDTIIR